MLETYKKQIQNLHGRHDHLQSRISQYTRDLEELKHKEDIEQKVLILIQESAKEIQDQVVIHITDVVDTALDALFPDRYQFKIDFVTKNNKTNADMYILENGYRIPANGALADILSVALRMAVWSLSKTDSVLVLDEPALGIEVPKRPLMAQLLKQLSEEMGIQIIMVSHTVEFIDVADKVYRL